ncbi:hypothetical protein ACFS2C_26940 [Prauserella oleivorans]|uniref:Uncharacterized protein n=1 Tax=Prauserella oleivorans TaxID=1478153 RepID=A0ABW5WKX4_9PSEU
MADRPRSQELRPIAAGAVCLVAYSYLWAWWLNARGETPAVLLTVREWVNVPLGIGEDFGVLGLGLLLAVGGFVVTESTVRRGPGATAGLLAVRAGLPLVMVALLAAALVLSGARPLGVADTGRPTPLGSVVADFGFGWVVWTGVVFCVLLGVTAPLLRGRPGVAAALHLAVLAALVVTGADADGWYTQVGLLASFGTFPVAGAVVWCALDGRLAGWAAGLLGVGCYALLVVAEHGYPDLAGWWYPLTWMYAVGLVLLAGVRPLPCPAPVRWAAERAYALLLGMGVAGYATLNALDGLVPWVVALLAALVVTGAVGEVVHRLVPRRQAVEVAR